MPTTGGCLGLVRRPWMVDGDWKVSTFRKIGAYQRHETKMDIHKMAIWSFPIGGKREKKERNDDNMAGIQGVE